MPVSSLYAHLKGYWERYWWYENEVVLPGEHSFWNHQCACKPCTKEHQTHPCDLPTTLKLLVVPTPHPLISCIDIVCALRRARFFLNAWTSCFFLLRFQTPHQTARTWKLMSNTCRRHASHVSPLFPFYWLASQVLHNETCRIMFTMICFKVYSFLVLSTLFINSNSTRNRICVVSKIFEQNSPSKTGWWFWPSWKNMSSSMGRMTSHIYIYMYIYIYIHILRKVIQFHGSKPPTRLPWGGPFQCFLSRSPPTSGQSLS